MEAGPLRHQFIVDENVETQDTSGAMNTTWTPIGTLMGSAEPLTGHEGLLANQTIAKMDTRVVVRWSPLADLLTAKHRLRLVFRGRQIVYNISQPPAEKNMRRRRVEIMCTQGANLG